LYYPARVGSGSGTATSGDCNKLALARGGALRKRLADFGGEPGGGTPEEFGQFIAAETLRYADIVKLSGAKME
jgi:hypothetical protein